MDKKKVLIFSLSTLVILFLLIFVFMFLQNSGSGLDPNKRKNLLKLINRYIEKEEYERALDKVEALLLDNADDKDILELQDLILQKKNKKEKTNGISYKLERQRFLDSMNTMIDKTEEKPVIVRRNTTQKETPANQQDEKQKKLNKLIDEGLDAYNNKDYIIAKDRFLKALDIDEANAEANAYLGATLYEDDPDDDRNVEEAIKRLKKAIKTDENLEIAHHKLAQIYDDKGLTDLAIEEYDKTLKINPNNYLAAYALGKIYYKSKDFRNAELNFYNSVKIKRDFVNGYFYLANTEFRLNKKENAKKYYKKVISLDPAMYHVYANLGKLYKLDSDYANALFYYQSAIKYNEKYTYHRETGDCYKELKQYDNAANSYLRSISLNPQNTVKDKQLLLYCYENLADIEKERGRYNDALDYVEKGLAYDSNSSILYYISAYSKSKLGRNAEAINDYLTSINTEPKNISPYVNLSKLYTETEDYQQAISIAQKGIIINNKQYELYNNLGISLQSMHKFDKAVDAFKKSILINPSDPDIHYNLGICYKQLRENNKAINSFQKAINVNMKYYDAYYELGESYFTEEQFNEAKTILELLISKKPDHPKRDQADKMLSIIGS